jgi:hypothetical protein
MNSQLRLEKRIAVEKRIARKVVDVLLAAGFALSLNNGGDEYEIKNSTDASAIKAAMFATDEERLYAMQCDRCVGWVYFVYGNDGWDVICDHTVNLEPYIGEGTEVEKAIERAEKEMA